MNKTIAGVIIVLILLVGAYFIFMNKPGESQDGSRQNDSQTQQSNNNQQDNTTTTQSQNSSLKQLLAQGSRKCTYSFSGDASKGEPNGTGTIYTANGNADMDISAVVNGATMKSRVVIKDGVYYGWVDGQPTGFKMTLNDADKYSNSSAQQGVDINQQQSYSCESWNPDSSKFSVPANIQFTDLASLNASMGN